MINEDRRNSFDALSVPSYKTPSEQSESSLTLKDTIKITSSMVLNLKCQTQDDVLSSYSPVESVCGDAYFEESSLPVDILSESTSEVFATEVNNPQLMIVYAEGDINSALHFLMESLQRPFAPDTVVTVLVEEQVRQELVERIRQRMRPLSEQAAMNPRYRATVKQLNSLDFKVVLAHKSRVPPPLSTPILVCECLQSMLGEDIKGVLCLHSFRSSDELLELCDRETVSFASVSVWNESLEGLYQLAASLDCSTFFFNCNNISLEPIENFVAQGASHACVISGFHYESLQIEDKMKAIVFPVRTHLAQVSPSPKRISLAPILLLDH